MREGDIAQWVKGLVTKPYELDPMTHVIEGKNWLHQAVTSLSSAYTHLHILYIRVIFKSSLRGIQKSHQMWK